MVLVQWQNILFTVTGKKGQYVWTEGHDEEALSRGVYNTYTSHNLRYSQVSIRVLDHNWNLSAGCFVCAESFCILCKNIQGVPYLLLALSVYDAACHNCSVVVHMLMNHSVCWPSVCALRMAVPCLASICSFKITRAAATGSKWLRAEWHRLEWTAAWLLLYNISWLLTIITVTSRQLKLAQGCCVTVKIMHLVNRPYLSWTEISSIPCILRWRSFSAWWW